MIFRYPGSKNKYLTYIIPYIMAGLDNADAFEDVFVGGGSVLLEVANIYPNIRLIANDKDENIFSFWQLTQDSNQSVNKFFQLILQHPTIELFYELRNRDPKDLIEKAYYAVFFNRTTFSGISNSGPIGGEKQKGEWKIDCRYNAQKIITDFLSIRKILKERLFIFNQHFQERLCTNNNSMLYLDPPYYEKGNQLYNVKMTEEDHIQLSNALKTKDLWILSYDDCESVRKLYDWADLDTMSVRYSIDGEKNDWKEKQELIIFPNIL